MELYHLVDKDFVYDVAEFDEMGDNHGLTYPDKRLIRIREDVYVRAADGRGRDRMTIAHEFGHLIMHRNVGLARRTSSHAIPSFKNSEWQANAFGGELLVSADHIHLCDSPEAAAELFGVTLEAARVQWNTFEREGIIKNRT